MGYTTQVTEPRRCGNTSAAAPGSLPQALPSTGCQPHSTQTRAKLHRSGQPAADHSRHATFSLVPPVPLAGPAPLFRAVGSAGWDAWLVTACRRLCSCTAGRRRPLDPHSASRLGRGCSTRRRHRACACRGQPARWEWQAHGYQAVRCHCLLAQHQGPNCSAPTAHLCACLPAHQRCRQSPALPHHLLLSCCGLLRSLPLQLRSLCLSRGRLAQHRSRAQPRALQQHQRHCCCCWQQPPGLQTCLHRLLSLGASRGLTLLLLLPVVLVLWL